MHRAVDAGKDQSYVLGVLTKEQLDHSLFPLGDSVKTDVRAEAAARGLSVAQKPDSHDICFIADGDNAGWLADKLGRRPGSVVDESGEVLGEHDGAYAFTIGQRRGLRLGVPADDGQPRYVLDIEPVSGTVTVGPREHLQVDGLECVKPLWAGAAPTGSLECTVQLRAHGAEHRAIVDVRRRPRCRSTTRTRVGHRPRPGVRDLRRHARRGLGDHRPHVKGLFRNREGRMRASGVGGMPGEDMREAIQIVLGEVGDLPFVPELPARGAGAEMIGRSLAMLDGLSVDLQPAGWRLTSGESRDQRRSRSLLAQDLDAVEELLPTSTPVLKQQMTGPWTLAATVERPRGRPRARRSWRTPRTRRVPGRGRRPAHQ